MPHSQGPVALTFAEAFHVVDSVRLDAPADDPVGHASDLVIWNGRVVLADAFQNNIKVFSPDGRHLTTIGRAGAGPGEFRGLSSIAVSAGGQLLAMDADNGLLSTFDRDGAFVSRVRLPGLAHHRVRRVGDGDLFAVPFTLRSDAQYAVDGLYTVNARGSIVDTIARATVPSRRFEGSINWLVADVIGDTVVWIAAKSNVVSFSNLSGRVLHSVALAESVYRAPDWPDDARRQIDPLEWIRRQLWAVDVMSTGQAVFVRFSTGGEGQSGLNQHYYSVLDRTGMEKAIVGPTAVQLHRGSSGAVLGTVIDDAGDVHLMSYDLRLAPLVPPAGGAAQGAHPAQAPDHRGDRLHPDRSAGANLFLQLVSRRYERSSILLTSNQSLGVWGEVFGDPVIASAILDRLLHHATTVNIKSDSYRLKEKRRAGLLRPATPPESARDLPRVRTLRRSRVGKRSLTLAYIASQCCAPAELLGATGCVAR